MNILIIEDEPPIAIDIKEMTCSILGKQINEICMVHTIDDAFEYLKKKTIDLCLLDLNLKGKNGYDILKESVSGSFHTIIISAYTDQAVEAFNYGVLDFIPKPVVKGRLETALNKYMGLIQSKDSFIKYLVVRKRNSNHLIAVDQICYFEAQRYIIRIHLKDGKTEIIEKPLNRLMQILPNNFLRVHRSYIVDINEIKLFKHCGGGTYELTLLNDEKIPLSPQAYHLLLQKADKK
jgi:DNA-binding LytR/AlgR family response regulator